MSQVLVVTAVEKLQTDKNLFWYKSTECHFMLCTPCCVEIKPATKPRCTGGCRRIGWMYDKYTTRPYIRQVFAIIFTRGLSSTKESVGLYPRSDSF